MSPGPVGPPSAAGALGDTAARTARAEHLLGMGRAAEARAQIAPVLASEPGNAAAQRMFVRCLLQLDDPETLNASKRAVVLAPDEEQSHRLASLAHTKAGLHDLAIQHAREAVRLAPHEWRTHHVLTHALTEVNPEAALVVGAGGIRVAPHEPAMHLAVGLAALKARHNAQAKESFRTVLRLDPANATARNNLAIVDLRAGRFGTAMHGFGAALAADPKLDLARGNIDAVTVTMLMKLRYLVIVSEFLAFQLVLDIRPDAIPMVAALLLASWAGLAGWGYSRIPARFRRYAVGMVRRRRRAAVCAAVILIAAIGVAIGPLLGIVRPDLGVELSAFAALSVIADAFWYSRLRAKAWGKAAQRNRASGKQT